MAEVKATYFWYNTHLMRKFCFLAFAAALAGVAHASWYWPFGSDEGGGKKPPRLSELMEGASTNIDAAVDFADEGKISEAVEAYRRALAELDRVERDYPDRVDKPEFATLRNKRAYVNAAIDSLLLGQIKANAKAVAVSDTTELEKKLAAERAAKKDETKDEKKKDEGEEENAQESKETAGSEPAAKPETAAAKPETVAAKPEPVAKPSRPLSPRDRVIADIEKGDWAAAELGINEMLVSKPNDAIALNLKAAMEVEQGKLKEAESTLDQAIMSNPRSPYAYYNMADLMLKRDPPNKGAARRYYETGRVMGGQKDERLEAALR